MEEPVAVVLTVSITAAGRRLGDRLPYDHVHGELAATVRRRWAEVDGLVLCCATGIAVRVIAPLLVGKAQDPAVVCVDEAGRFAVALVGAHAKGANDLARDIAAQLGAEAVITTATDGAGLPALDDLPGAAPQGRLFVVGLGPGDPRLRTPAAVAAIRSADVVVGYDLYIDQCGDLLTGRQAVVRSPIGAEADRCADALGRAAAGARVALVCSGDPGVFAMATLVGELAPRYGSPPIEVVPGITAASAASALVGAPLGHDHALISLSDLLTPWSVIERRLRAVAEGDLAVALYNPRSLRRTWQLDEARRILLDHRPSRTPVAIVTDATRPGERIVRTTLAELDPEQVSMLSIVLVGSSTTTVIGDLLVTPRGYTIPTPKELPC